MTPTGEPRRAIVLAGGAAKGAFEVGALASLVERGLAFTSIIGTSAGALNAAYFAAGVRAGREREAAHEMVEFWLERARWRTFLDLSARDIATLRGLSRSTRAEAVLRDRLLLLSTLPARHEVQLRMVASRLAAAPGAAGALTHEHVFAFQASDFATRVDDIARAAVASGAFPGLFAPVDVPDIGLCVDGGLVANTPLAEAIALGDVDEVYVVTPWTAADGDADRLGGLSLLSRWIEIAVSERFNREVAQAERRHAQLQVLADERDRGVLSDEQHGYLQRRLGLRNAARIIVIRPSRALPGNVLTAFGDRSLRAEYIARGRAAADEVILKATA